MRTLVVRTFSAPVMTCEVATQRCAQAQRRNRNFYDVINQENDLKELCENRLCKLT